MTRSAWSRSAAANALRDTRRGKRRRGAIVGSLGVVVVLSCGGSGDPNKPDDMMMLSGSGGQPAMFGTGSGGAASTPVMNGGSAGMTGNMMMGSGGSPVAASTGGSGAVADAGAMVDDCPTCAIPKNCQGFPLEGLKYSPGGDVLPNKCKPYNATTNNPYAVRCIDAMALEFKTRFPGDQYCILPPPPDKGIQVGLHPQGNGDRLLGRIWAGDYSGYDKAAGQWVSASGRRNHAELPRRRDQCRRST